MDIASKTDAAQASRLHCIKATRAPASKAAVRAKAGRETGSGTCLPATTTAILALRMTMSVEAHTALAATSEARRRRMSKLPTIRLEVPVVPAANLLWYSV